ncbi:hypothetical protein L2E82_01108 [Cichorium intybus]|uniref:Uncharacterized protein n=1 Tax=Cichorium intybus TaxID=13427 RepID=A0ACB9GYN9_CICIN|nr:hypothetical protein L2E82_01108 [Cichorium intybus]
MSEEPHDMSKSKRDDDEKMFENTGGDGCNHGVAACSAVGIAAASAASTVATLDSSVILVCSCLLGFYTVQGDGDVTLDVGDI